MVKLVNQSTDNEQIQPIQKGEVTHKGYNWKTIRCCSTALLTKSLIIGSILALCLLSCVSAEDTKPKWRVGCAQTYGLSGRTHSTQNGLNMLEIMKNNQTLYNIIKPFLKASLMGSDNMVSCDLYSQALLYEGDINDFVYTPKHSSSASALDIPSFVYLLALGILFG